MTELESRPADRGVDGEQLELPIDQFQRYLLTSRLVRLLDVPSGGRILDLGGAPGPIEMFLPDYEVIVLDVQGEHPGGRFVIADGGALPFGDNSFDAVVSLDTLEHVPTGVRPSFLSEARRVSTGAVVLSAPFDTPGVAAAERALLEFISRRLSPQFPTAVWLQEHADWGLPQLDATLTGLSGGEWVAAALPSGYLPRWLGTMVIDHELLATGLPDLNSLHAYYNEFVSPADARTPSYRHIVAASCRVPADELRSRVASLRSTPEEPAEAAAALAAMAGALLQHRLGGPFTSPELKGLREQVQNLERVVADRDAHLMSLRAHNAALEKHNAALEQELAALRNQLIGPRVLSLIRRASKGHLR